MKTEIDCANQIVRMSRKIYFSSAHLYFQTKWSIEENTRVFGQCYSEHGHGHNYILEAFFEGPIDPRTGLLVNLIDVEPILKQLIGEFDHQHINFTHPYFRNLVPTTENIAFYLNLKIQKLLVGFKSAQMKLYKLKLFEDTELWVEISN